MAVQPTSELVFREGCGDCGERRVKLPDPLPPLGDDFDWDVRDYDGFRLFMLEELAARFPERRSWSPADMEVVLVEALAVVLDQLADMHDRIQAETNLETARRPDTVRRLLELIGYRPLLHAQEVSTNEELENLWRRYPHRMEEARRAGPASVRQQLRLVTLQDYHDRMLAHPLVLDVRAISEWSGSWSSHRVIVRLINNLLLDDELTLESIAGNAPNPSERLERLTEQLHAYYQEQEIPLDHMPELLGSSSRTLLHHVIERQRMVGQAVWLEDASLAGIALSLSVRIAEAYFRSEIRDAIRQVLLDDTNGFFASGRLGFGEDLVASDIVEVLMTIDGVESVCINRMKRIGAIYPDQSESGRIPLKQHEVAVLEDDPQRPERGTLRLTLHGGRTG